MIIAKTKLWGGAARLPKYDFTGAAPLFFKDSQGNWEMVFLSGCTVTFSRLKTDVDVFLVGGGMNAGDSQGRSGYAQGGNGGKGGGIVNDTLTLEEGVEYSVVIGGAGQATKAFGKTAAAGEGSNGGAGAVSPGYAAGDGADGVLAFNNTGGTLYENGTPIKFGAGGGGGAAKASSSAAKMAAGSGGATGGGDGGGGGGGGGRDNSTGGSSPGPGRGGSGIVIIRNARAST